MTDKGMADDGMRCDVAHGSTDGSARPCGEYSTDIVGSIGAFDCGISCQSGWEMLETDVLVALDDVIDGAKTLLGDELVVGGVVGGVGGRLSRGM